MGFWTPPFAQSLGSRKPGFLFLGFRLLAPPKGAEASGWCMGIRHSKPLPPSRVLLPQTVGREVGIGTSQEERPEDS
jgi:hypothetical protein